MILIGQFDSPFVRRVGIALLDSRLSHADIAFTCAYTLASEAVPDLLSAHDLPALRAHAGRLESMPEFVATRQAFVINR